MKKDVLKVLDFAVHLAVGTVMFLLLGLSALGVGLFADFVDTVHYSFVVHTGLKVVEYFMFTVDVLLLLKHIGHGLVQLFSKE